MKRLAIILAGFAAVPAHAGPDYPHRDFGQVIALDMSLPDATSCIARSMDRYGSVLVLPNDGGDDIDFSAGTMFGGSVNEAWISFKVRPDGDASNLRVFYRHPVIAKGVRGI